MEEILTRPVDVDDKLQKVNIILATARKLPLSLTTLCQMQNLRQ